MEFKSGLLPQGMHESQKYKKVRQPALNLKNVRIAYRWK